MRPLPALVLALAAFSGAAAETPQRIVSIGGSVTEVLYALGLGDRIIAGDSTSLYPPAAQDLAQVGYVRALAAELIIAMDADLVLAEGDAGPPAVLQQLREAGVPVTLIADTPSPEGVVEKAEAVIILSDKFSFDADFEDTERVLNLDQVELGERGAEGAALLVALRTDLCYLVVHGEHGSKRNLDNVPEDYLRLK